MLRPVPAAAIDSDPEGRVHVKAWIDGSDYVYIQHGGGALWYVHRNWQFPGLWQYPGGAPVYYPPLPAYIDGVVWQPEWPDYRPYPYGGYIHLGQRSLNTYLSPLPHPRDAWTITGLNHLAGRGEISIVQYPSGSNAYLAIVLLDDDQQFGADWYEFELSWTARDLGSVIKVSWLPQIANAHLAPQRETSLPLTFQLYRCGVNLITTLCPVSLVITGPNSFSHTYELGEAAERLRWSSAPDYYYYVAASRGKELARLRADGTAYTATVYWGNTVLGSLEFR